MSLVNLPVEGTDRSSGGGGRSRRRGADVPPARRSGGSSGRRSARTASPLGAAALIGLVCLASLLAPVLSPYDPTVGDNALRLAPVGTPGHLLGPRRAGA